MNLYANLTFDVASTEGCTVAARYAPAESSLPPLWLSSDCSATSFALLRLRPSTFYDVALVVSVDGATTIEWRGAFETQGTGWAAFDEGPRASTATRRPAPRDGRRQPVLERADHGRPGGPFGLRRPLRVALGVRCFERFGPGTRRRRSKYNSTHNRTKEFDGLLAIDAEGYVVWYYHAWSLEAWDFLPDNGVVLVARDDGTKLDGAKTYRDDGRTYNGNSQLQEISPLGDIRKQFISACAGSPLNYNMVSHECRADRDGEKAAPARGGRLDDALRRAPHPRRLDVVYDLFDLAKPVAGSATPFVTKNWDDVDMWCSGNATMEGVSSVSVGVEENVLVASRTLNTIWSLAHDGSGAQWTLSSTLNASDAGVGDGGIWYAFEDDDEKFYDPHSALQLPNGDLLVIDDGDDRPGCATANTSGCYSRAIAYELDAAARVAKVRWQFEWPSALDVNFKTDDLYNLVGGSAAALANGDYLVAFTSLDDTNKYDSRGTAFAFEVNVDGRSTVTTVAIPTPKADQDRQAAYRLVPWDSVGGETDVCPFLEAGSG
ncbi:hypothetical protein JL720_12559 [Aureococcus anophagefferens]|nr:hypothetical protein JL720_12559 [Aureococcus anophagefferens]